MDIETIKKVEAESDCLVNAEQLSDALDAVAKNIIADLKDKNPVVLCVMTGGVIPTGHLLTRLTFPLQIDYIHATRYRGETSGGTLHWLQEPTFSLEGRTVLIIDDIFDEGITLMEIARYCEEKGAAEVKSMVMVNKLHDRKAEYQPDYIGIDVEDRYLFGFGMDYKNYLRNLNAIHAVKGM